MTFTNRKNAQKPLCEHKNFSLHIFNGYPIDASGKERWIRGGPFQEGGGHIVSEQSLNFIYTLLKATIQSFIVPFPTLAHFMRGEQTPLQSLCADTFRTNRYAANCVISFVLIKTQKGIVRSYPEELNGYYTKQKQEHFSILVEITNGLTLE